jgi:CubicO group peptidase (beta-lactamase class C family)
MSARNGEPGSARYEAAWRRRLVGLSVSTLLALAGCGGGGGGGDSSAQETPPPTNPPPANTPPVVQAGADQSIELPFSATLQGTATDDGQPGALTYQWAVAGGATGVTFADATAASTTVTFAAAGTFELTLTASDGTASATDSVLITVAAAMYPARDDESTDHGWTRVAAAGVGMDQASLELAATVAQTSGSAAGTVSAGMIVRRGRLVHSWGDIDRRFDLKSTTKSIGGMALGLALDDGLLALNDAAQTRLPSIGVPPSANTGTGWLDDITIRQLATHTAGFPKGGGFEALIYQPGTHWFYSDGSLNWLADLLTAVLNQDLATTLQARVWSVLGVDGADPAAADDVQWRPNQFRPGPHPSGIEHRELASGISANVNAMARVGLLFLRNGVWSNGQRVLSEEFVEGVRVPSDANLNNPDEGDFPDAVASYGMLWWTNARGSSGQLPNVPADAYWAWGLGDSLIVVIPSLDLVIVRAGQQGQTSTPAERVWNDDDWNGHYSVLAPFLDPIASSVQR